MSQLPDSKKVGCLDVFGRDFFGQWFMFPTRHGFLNLFCSPIRLHLFLLKKEKPITRIADQHIFLTTLMFLRCACCFRRWSCQNDMKFTVQPFLITFSRDFTEKTINLLFVLAEPDTCFVKLWPNKSARTGCHHSIGYHPFRETLDGYWHDGGHGGAPAALLLVHLVRRSAVAGWRPNRLPWPQWGSVTLFPKSWLQDARAWASRFQTLVRPFFSHSMRWPFVYKLILNAVS